MNNKPTPILPATDEVEIWRTHPIYDYYEISSFGRVRNKENQYVLTNGKGPRGYLHVHLRRGISNVNGKLAKVHRLVAEAFHGLDPENREIDHIDRNPENNYYKNLQFVSHIENIANRREDREPYVLMHRPALVLVDNDTKELIKEYSCLREAMEDTGYSASSIRGSVHRRRCNFAVGHFMLKSEYDDLRAAQD